MPVAAYVDGDEVDERGPPPRAPVLVAVAARRPSPVVVHVDPAAVVIRSPAPIFVRDPGPAVRVAPDPTAVAVRRPVVVVVDDGRVRAPDVAVVARVLPVAVEV